MLGSIVLDIVIGLIFIFLLYSLLTTTIVEIIATYFQLRARNLSQAMKMMLDDDKTKVFADDFYSQPVIKYLSNRWLKIMKKPSYIANRNFSKGVIELLKGNNESNTILDRIHETLKEEKNRNSETARFIKSLLEDSNNDLMKFKQYLEEWFDDTMERASGWYKKWIQIITLFVGFLVAFAFNVDTLKIVDKLSKDPKARTQFVELATALAENGELQKIDSINLDKTFKELTELSTEPLMILSIERNDFWDVNLLGILITAIAISLGAPFWFDLLNKFVKLRSSVQQKIGQDQNEAKK